MPLNVTSISFQLNEICSCLTHINLASYPRDVGKHNTPLAIVLFREISWKNMIKLKKKKKKKTPDSPKNEI